MLVITKSLAGQTIIVTLSEKKTITSPYYLFVFSSVTTSDVIQAQYFYSDDISEYPVRYNEFEVDQTLFAAAATGQYKYDVYEKPTDEVVADLTTLNKIECGQMELKPATEITRKGYDAPTTAKKGYAG